MAECWPCCCAWFAAEARESELSRCLPIHTEPVEILYTGWVQDNTAGLIPSPSDWDLGLDPCSAQGRHRNLARR
jgi:hypothetical protein